jgi:hypothetical protein
VKGNAPFCDVILISTLRFPWDSLIEGVANVFTRSVIVFPRERQACSRSSKPTQCNDYAEVGYRVNTLFKQ